MRYVCNRWWLVLRFGCFIEPRTKRVDSGVQSQLFWSLLCSVFLRIMVVKVAGWLLPVICRCRCQNAGYASFIKFVYHRRGNVQNAAIFQSQQLMNRGIYIYIYRHSCNNTTNAIFGHASGQGGVQSRICGQILSSGSRRISRIEYWSRLSRRCAVLRYKSLVLSFSLIFGSDSLHQFVKLPELLIYSRCIALAS